jgi:hypothetical protein
MLIQQLKDIKEELKITRKQRDEFKLKYNESLNNQDDKGMELAHMIKDAIEKLIFEINIK